MKKTHDTTTDRIRKVAMRNHLSRYKVYADIASVTRICNAMNGLIYVAIAFSFWFRPSSTSIQFFETSLPIMPAWVWPFLYIFSSLLWFIPPKSFFILSVSAIPLVIALVVQSVYILFYTTAILWPVAMYLSYGTCLCMVNLVCYIKINQRGNK